MAPYLHLISRHTKTGVTTNYPCPTYLNSTHTPNHKLCAAKDKLQTKAALSRTTNSHNKYTKLRPLRKPIARFAMDDHHYQPIWPMVQGAFDYIMNVFGEVWSMIWKPAPDSRHQAMTEPLIAPPNDNGSMLQAANPSIRLSLNNSKTRSRPARLVHRSARLTQRLTD